MRSQDTPSVLSLISGNEDAGDLAWEFFKKNKVEFYKRYKEGHVMPNLIKVCCYRFKTLNKMDEIREFFKKNEAPTAKLAVQQVLEAIKVNYNFLNYNKDVMKKWQVN